MYQVITDPVSGTIKITDNFLDSQPQFEKIGDEFGVVFTDLKSINTFKTFYINYDGKNEYRYLYTQYRVSRDLNNWTLWQELSSNITNFPPFTSTDTMYLEVKFTRAGTITTGVITLVCYTLCGSLFRNIII